MESAISNKTEEGDLSVIHNDDISIISEHVKESATENNVLGDGDKQNSLCKICKYVAKKKRGNIGVLSCHKCNELVHFHCSRLPPYMIYNLSTTSKKYACEICAEAPKTFLLKIIENVGKQNDNVEEIKADCVYERIEKKVDSLYELIEKYDIPSVADRVQGENESFIKLNNKCTENIGLRYHDTLRYNIFFLSL